MASGSTNASDSSAGEGRASGSAVPTQDAQHVNDKSRSDSAQPRAGRTGKVGAKAERPADSRMHKGSEGGAEPSRDGKAPSPAAREGDPSCGQLPQPVRDSTG